MNRLLGVRHAGTAAEILAEYPDTAVVRVFNSGVITPQNIVPKLKKLCDEAWGAGLIVAVSFKFSVADVLSGAWKPFIQSAMAWLKDNGTDDMTILILWHEPENDVPKYFKDAEEYVKYFNLLHSWIKEVTQDVMTVHAALGYRYGNKENGTPIDIDNDRAKMWGKTRADLKTGDFYTGRTNPLTSILPELTSFKRWLTYTVGSEPYGISERGWSVSTAGERNIRAGSILAEMAWLLRVPDGQRCTLYLPWLTDGAEHDAGLLPDANMATAVKDLMRTVSAPPVVTPEPQTDCPLCLGTGHVARGPVYTIVRTT